MASLIITEPALSRAAIAPRAGCRMQTLADSAKRSRWSVRWLRLAPHFLNGEDGAEGFFLEQARWIGIDVDDYGWLEEIWAEVGAGIAAAENFCADELRHLRSG